MAFSNWADLKQQMLDDLASGVWRSISSYSLPGPTGARVVTYRSLDDFLKLLARVEDEAARESGVPAYQGRTRAGQGGRG